MFNLNTRLTTMITSNPFPRLPTGIRSRSVSPLLILDDVTKSAGLRYSFRDDSNGQPEGIPQAATAFSPLPTYASN